MDNYAYVFDDGGGLKGFGARIYQILNAAVYAKQKGCKFVRKTGEIWPETKKSWTEYFTSIPDEVDRPKEHWPYLTRGADYEKSLEIYGETMVDLFTMQPRIEAEVKRRVQRSSFRPSEDIVVHLRRSDKIKQDREYRTLAESTEIKLEEVKRAISGIDGRLFILTDDESFLPEIVDFFPDREVIWDPNEKRRAGVCTKIFTGTLDGDETEDEFLTALKNLRIMADSKVLVGGRMSYFFRIGELLRYDRPTINLRDSNVFGGAEYDPENKPKLSYLIPRNYEDGINGENYLKINEYIEAMKRDGMVSIPNFFDDELAEHLWELLEDYNPDWLVYAVNPDENWKSVHLRTEAERDAWMPQIRKHLQDGNFCYSFKRTDLSEHFEGCWCVACKLQNLIRSERFMQFVSDVSGKPLNAYGETFYSRYENGDFLTIHHDKGKGDCTFILGFTKDWRPTQGGLLHFWNEDEQRVYRTFVPSFNTLTLFNLVPGKQIDHFVSEVVTEGKRHSFTGWLWNQKI